MPLSPREYYIRAKARWLDESQAYHNRMFPTKIPIPTIINKKSTPSKKVKSGRVVRQDTPVIISFN